MLNDVKRVIEVVYLSKNGTDVEVAQNSKHVCNDDDAAATQSRID